MSIYKNGIWTGNSFHEFNSVEPYADERTYTPASEATNSCLNLKGVDLTEFKNTTSSIILRIEIDVEYSGFDFSEATGTAKLYWQGSNYSITEETWKWEGTNYLTTALNNQQSLLALVDGAGSGTYHYNNTIEIPASWWDTYSKSNVGVRCDYSNGVGTITLKNLKVYLNSEYGNDKAKINSNQNVVANSFIEI